MPVQLIVVQMYSKHQRALYSLVEEFIQLVLDPNGEHA